MLGTAAAVTALLIWAWYGPVAFGQPGGGGVTYTIATGMKGGTYQRIGRNLAKILNNGVKFVTKDTDGGRDNLVDLLNGEVQFGFVQKPILADFARSNSKEAGKITVIARICPAYLQLVVSKKSEQKLVTVTDQAKQPSPEYVDVVAAALMVWPKSSRRKNSPAVRSSFTFTWVQ